MTLQEFLGMPETADFTLFGKKELLGIIEKLAADLGWENGPEEDFDSPLPEEIKPWQTDLMLRVLRDSNYVCDCPRCIKARAKKGKEKK